MTTSRIPQQCQIAGCTAPYLCKGYCRRHYRRLSPTLPTCIFEGCNRIHESKGYCTLHYRRLRKYGDPTYTQTMWGTGNTPEERYWDRVDKSGECWEWQGKLGALGYGAMHWKGKTQQVHRIAWLLETGAMPKDCILHRCDNRKCVNPAHLREGTQLENIQDMKDKGRAYNGRRPR
jgi:hypothetical protein